MPDLFLSLDTSQPPGQQLAPELISEIQEVAPSAVVNGSITEAKLADDAVTNAKLGPGAVTSVKIAASGVGTANLANDSVTEDKIADSAVTPDKVGIGVVTAKNAAGSHVSLTVTVLTAAQFAAIGTPNPNTLYGTY